MKSKTNTTTGRLAQLGFLVVALFGFSQAAQATLAADHVIQNSVTVQYLDAAGNGDPGDGGNPYADTDTVDITVQLVAAGPEVVFNAANSDSTDPVSPSTTITLEFSVTSNANGVDDYTLTTPTFAGAASGNGESQGTSTPATLTLGGTSYAGDGTTFGDPLAFAAGLNAGPFTFDVPMDDDGDTDANTLSGFETGQGQILVFRATGTGGGAVAGDVVCTVDSVTQGALVNDTATITVSACDTGDFDAREVVFGDQIGERETVDVPVTVGTAEGVLDYSPVVRSETDNAETGTTAAPVSINIVAVSLRVEKFVRNVTPSSTLNPTCAGAAEFECLTIQGGLTYYAEGVGANPGDTLEYAILLYNETSAVSGVVGEDPYVLFTNYSAGTADLYPNATAANGGAVCAGNAGTCTVDDGAGGAPFKIDGTDGTTDDFFFDDSGNDRLLFSGGNNGTTDQSPTSETAGGLIPASASGGTTSNVSVITFQVIVES